MHSDIEYNMEEPGEDDFGPEFAIPSYRENEEGECCVNTLEDFERLVKVMDFRSIEHFTEETGATPDMLLGKFWQVIHNRVYLHDDSNN